MSKEILGNSFGVQSIAHFDDIDNPGGITLTTEQDADPLLEHAKILADQTPGKEFRHVAVIPAAVMDQAFREGWFNDDARWNQWLNDPNNRAFRTWQGRV